MVRSLLPYLGKEGQGIFLELEPASDNRQMLERMPFPFKIVPTADPLLRIAEARLVTAEGALIEPLWIILSRDDYRLPSPFDQVVTNTLIDEIWERSFIQMAVQADRDPGVALLPKTPALSASGNYEPLFYCRRKGAFFSPPCPECGETLELCTDDTLLARHGLPPYTASLKRFLFCPKCASQGAEPGQSLRFYCKDEAFAAGFSGGDSGQTAIKVAGAQELILAWAALVEKKSFSSGLPCIECKHNVVCFGPDQEATGLITFISFYPFRAIFVRRPRLSARDWLTSLPRQDRGYLFGPGHERFAIELCYLKAAFLAEWLRGFLAARLSSIRPEPLKVLDRTWIYQADPAGLLPARWAFFPAYIGLSDDLESLFEEPAPQNHLLYLAGTVWLQTFCAPEAQRLKEFSGAMKEVVARLEERGGQGLPEERELVSELLETAPHIFGMEAAFSPLLEPPGPNDKMSGLPKEMEGIWKEILGLGLSLVSAGISGREALSSPDEEGEAGLSGPWSQWMERVDRLTERLKKALFRVEAEGAAAPVEGEKAEEEGTTGVELSPEDKALSEILLGYLKEMRQQAQPSGHAPEVPPQPPPTSPPPPTEGKVAAQGLDEESTLPFGIGADEGAGPLLAGGDTGSEEEEETLIVSADLASAKPGQSIPGQDISGPNMAGPGTGQEMEEDVPETVILGPGSGQIDLTSGLAPESPGKGAKDQSKDRLKDRIGQDLGKTSAETLSETAPTGSQEAFGMPGPDKVSGPPPDVGKGPDDKGAQGRDQKREDEDEFLAETVILTPQDLKPPEDG